MEIDYMISKEILLEAAKKKGLTNKDYIEKDYFQDLFLFHLYKKTNLLIFKGGTALYKLYSLPRFSEDLDFSVLKKFDAENLISDVAEKTEGRIKSVKKLKNSLLIKIQFKGILTEYNTLRIDVSLQNIVFGYEIKNYVPAYIDINPFTLRALNLKEMVAEKVHSIVARQSARDLYDLFFLLRFTEPDKNIIEKKLKIFNMKFDAKKFQKQVDNLAHLWSRELRPFILTDLVNFDIARNFVLEKMKGLLNKY